jgi:hypothetical protein
MALFTWAHFRILTGTLVGGALGFYIKHNVELRYKQKMREEMLKYDNEQRLKSEKSTVDSSELLSDS